MVFRLVLAREPGDGREEILLYRIYILSIVFKHRFGGKGYGIRVGIQWKVHLDGIALAGTHYERTGYQVSCHL